MTKRSYRFLLSVLVSFLILLILTQMLIDALHSKEFWAKIGAPVVFLLALVGVYSATSVILFLRPSLIPPSQKLPSPFTGIAAFLLAYVAVLLFLWPLALAFYCILDSPEPPTFKVIILDTFKALSLYASVLLGMAAKWGWDEVRRFERRPKRSLNLLLLAKPLLISPIVFLFMWALLKKQPVGLVYYLLGFQNGFFWQSILYPK